MEHVKAYLGQRLQQARKEAGLKQEQVAQYLQVPTSAISAMEHGQRKLEAYELFLLGKLYAKPLEWFFDERMAPAQHRNDSWYKNDLMITELLERLKTASPDMRKRCGLALCGFLNNP